MTDEQERCRALTGDGERCSRPAREDGFCFQHDESDPTVDDESTDGEASDGDDSGSAADESDETGTDSPTDEEHENRDTMSEDTEENDQGQSESDGESDGDVGLLDIRNRVYGNATALIGHPLDAVVAVSPDGDEGWRAVVEVVERSSVPDTEDILGRYEVFLDDGGNFQSYGRLDRYRRADTDAEAV